MKAKVQQLTKYLKSKGILKTSEIVELGISKDSLRKLLAEGSVERVARGYYALPDQNYSAMQSVIEVSKLIPNGVICLLSALRFHGFTSQNPKDVWIAVERRAHKSQIVASTAIRCIRPSGAVFSSGVRDEMVNQIPVRVYCPAKTVVDCFKYRNKIGIDVALEALREGWMEKRFTMDELWEYAKICRVSNVMRPYMESLVS